MLGIFFFKLCLYSPLPQHMRRPLDHFLMFPSLSARQVSCGSGRPILVPDNGNVGTVHQFRGIFLRFAFLHAVTCSVT